MWLLVFFCLNFVVDEVLIMIKKILFVASEMVPFIKTGGLGDVIGSLPIELESKNIDVRVIIPFYKNIKRDGFKFDLITEINVFDDLNQKAKIYFLNYNGLPVYFVENDDYFGREKIYGYDDDYMRFAFFSRVALDFLPKVKFRPDIINFNDWQTGLGCLYLKDFYSKQDFYQQIKSVFTIHNLQYQGIFDKKILEAVKLDEKYFSVDSLEFYGNINFMKAGILYSDAVTTVSPTYAKEIQTKEYGYGLDGLLKYKNNITGILNGLDQKKYDPEKDKNIVNFGIRDFSGKNLNKKKLCAEFGFKYKNLTPVVSILSRFAEQKGFDIIYRALGKILKLDLQLIIVGTGDSDFENLFLKSEFKDYDNFSLNIIFDEELAKQVYAGSDIFLMPSKFEPCGLAQMISMKYGTIPVARKTGGLIDTIKDFFVDKKNGNGFLFEEYSPEALFLTLKKVIEVYKNKFVWRNLVLNAMKSDFSWDLSAEKYIELYNSL